MTDYLFDSDLLYTPNSLTPEKVERLTLECYDVHYSGTNMVGTSNIRFKIRGRGDTIYQTSYNWALLLNTPENRKAIAHRNSLRHKCEEAERGARRAHAQVIKFT